MSESLPVVVKHAGKSYNITIDLNEPGVLFKSQIFSLTNVPPERQKVLLKGGQLKDDSDLKTFNLKPNQTVMVLGTPDGAGVPQKPKEKIVFTEDLEAQGKFVEFNDKPLGLTNLGNTCYLNSTLQALNTVGELKDAVDQYKGSDRLVVDLNNTFKRLVYGKIRGNGKFIVPSNIVNSLRETFPQFAEVDRHGPKQQDAEECLSQILTHLNRTLDNGFVQKHFGLKIKKYQNCEENDPEDKEVVSYEDELKLSCHITRNTNFLQNGLQESLQDHFTMNNPHFGRDAKYVSTKKLLRLPVNLNINFVRFFWKVDARQNSKILRKVVFPMRLDITDLLDESVKAKNIKVRDEIHKIEKEKEDEYKEKRKTKKIKTDHILSNKEKFEKDEREFLANEAKWLEKFKTVYPDDLEEGEAPSPLYELNAVITHKGTSADSGHYQSFVRNKKDLSGDSWFFFNDDKVSEVGRDKIESLAGGGESDIALVLFYRAVGI